MKVVQVCECEGCHEYHEDSEVIFKCSNCGCEICVTCGIYDTFRFRNNTITFVNEEIPYCTKCHNEILSDGQDLNKSNKGKHRLLTPHEYDPNDPLDPKNMDVAKILEEERKKMRG